MMTFVFFQSFPSLKPEAPSTKNHTNTPTHSSWGVLRHCPSQYLGQDGAALGAGSPPPRGQRAGEPSPPALDASRPPAHQQTPGLRASKPARSAASLELRAGKNPPAGGAGGKTRAGRCRCQPQGESMLEGTASPPQQSWRPRMEPSLLRPVNKTTKNGIRETVIDRVRGECCLARLRQRFQKAANEQVNVQKKWMVEEFKKNWDNNRNNKKKRAAFRRRMKGDLTKFSPLRV